MILEELLLKGMLLALACGVISVVLNALSEWYEKKYGTQ